ncbi:MAG: alpha-2-macroglobulin family protein [Thermoguttaceae bacterium]
MKSIESIQMKSCLKLTEQGLWKEALEQLVPWTLSKNIEPNEVGKGQQLAIQCLSMLNRTNEIDAYLEEVITVHSDNWRLLQSAAQSYLNMDHSGFMIAGQFERGPNRGGGQYASAVERDRVRALQLMQQASELLKDETDKGAVADFYYQYAQFWKDGRDGELSWMLQNLTDLAVLPDYVFGYENYYFFRPTLSKAPVDVDENPVYYTIPAAFSDAKNDGERWRWCLEQSVVHDPAQFQGRTLLDRARFSQNQFGVETMIEYSFFFRNDRMKNGASSAKSQDSDGKTGTREQETGTWALHTLAENETIAKLAIGIRRWMLPDEQDYIALYKKVVEVGSKDEKQEALTGLAQIFENRRQYPKAAEYWNRLLKDFPLADSSIREMWKNNYDQIVKNWGQFQPTQSDVSGKGADLQYLFRNGNNVRLTAHEIRIPELIADVKTYIRTRPSPLSWEKIDIEGIGYQLVVGNVDRRKYLGREVARWTVPLEPAAHHFDRRVMISTPLMNSGAYLVEAQMEEGNTDYIVVWLNDTGIIRKPLENKIFYYVADAATGNPIPNATVDFFGYKISNRMETDQQRGRRRVSNDLDYDIQELTETTDVNGQLIVGNDKVSNQFQWLITATTPNDRESVGKKGRFSYVGFIGVWYNQCYDESYNQVKAFFISDRPVYRPKDKVQYKFWVGTAKYDLADSCEMAGKELVLSLFSPKGDRIEQKVVLLDPFGGVNGEVELPDQAELGVYHFRIAELVRTSGEIREGRIYGDGTIRVEEYRKPEYEVTVEAPTEPVAVGEPISAKIKAKYYFGTPVQNAKVKYKVLREPFSSNWYPVRPWDWFYGPGYAWFAYDTPWYPGWTKWGCVRPIGFWFPKRPTGPPEVVLEREVEIGPDGTVAVEFDTSFVKEAFPNDDQKYTITAEVVDQSRRTIVGSGTVLLAREPFTVRTWVNRGYYEPNQAIQANVQAKRLDGKPISGDAVLKLFKITYPGSSDRHADLGDAQTDKSGNAQSNRSQTGPIQTDASLEKNVQLGVPIGPKETEVYSAPISLDEEGCGSLTLNAGETGQYRFSCIVKDSVGHEQEGGYIFSVYGPKRAGTGSFEFNALELIPDKAEYAPNETVDLRVNTNRTDSTILLFVRPSNGVYLPPQMLKLDGKSTSVKIPVSLKDMPNFFVEAVTVVDGQTITEQKEIVVPPEKRILNVDVQPSSSAYKPGEKGKVQLKITDFEGKPVVGQHVVSVYDKSVEYISGGSNVGDIREFFWKWRRYCSPTTWSNMERYFPNMTPPNAHAMQFLGVFGATVADETAEYGMVATNGMVPGNRGQGKGRLGIAEPRMMQRNMMMKGMDAGGPPAPAAAFSTSPQSGEMLLEVAYDASVADSSSSAGSVDSETGGSGTGLVEPAIRKDFADTALWVGAVETNEDGIAEIELQMPENLTTWKINVWSMSVGTRVGYGQAEVLTRKDLIIRMQTPRFLVQKDQVLLTANVHNYLDSEKQVQVVLELDGPTLIPGPETQLIQTVQVPSQGEVRVDWSVLASVPGDAVIRMKALTDQESDAMQKSIPVYVHGMLKQEAQSGMMKQDETSRTVEIQVPEERRPDETRLTVRFSPTLAGSMIDALPYLVHYPYGCTEQTLNRFLPTILTQKVLIEMGVDLAVLEKEHANLNAQELGDSAERAELRRQAESKSGSGNVGGAGPFGAVQLGGVQSQNPVYRQSEVNNMVVEGVKRLSEMQLSDGGWGWFSGYGEHASAHLTALVVRGLHLARSCDAVVDADVVERGVNWLKKYQAEQVSWIKNGQLDEQKRRSLRWKSQADETDALIYMVLLEVKSELAKPNQGRPGIVRNSDQSMNEMREFLYRDRTKLSLYGVAMLGLALQMQNDLERARMCERMLEQYLVLDQENQTAYLNLPGFGATLGFWRWWSWCFDEIETQAYYLRLLVRLNPKSEVAPLLVKYLLNNRKNATYWNSTRDTAVCVESFAEFLRATGENQPNMTVEVWVDGENRQTVEINPKNMLLIDNTVVLEGADLASGKHMIEFRKSGTGPLYFNTYLQNFTLEDPITRAGLEVKIDRKFYLLTRKTDAKEAVAGGRGQSVELNVEKYERTPITERTELKSGDLVEVELLIESKNDYEYLLIEDFKAAGFEPVETQSGYNGNPLNAYVEFRDNRVSFFLNRLARGQQSLSYRIRAEQPGQFSVLPSKIEAMYAPELKGNSDEFKLQLAE